MERKRDIMARKFSEGLKKGLQKSLTLTLSFSKLKSPSSRSWLLPSSCNYPKTPPSPSHPDVSNKDSATLDGATLSDIDRYLSEHFSSLYCGGGGGGGGSIDFTAEFSPRSTDPPAEAIKATRRFFVDQGRTNSLIEEAQLQSARASLSKWDGTAVIKVSEDPYVDFLKSMEEMVDAQHMDLFGSLDWGFLEELLVCYLDLNEKSVHDSIVRAFKDLIEGLRLQSMQLRRMRRRRKIGLTELRWRQRDMILPLEYEG